MHTKLLERMNSYERVDPICTSEIAMMEMIYPLVTVCNEFSISVSYTNWGLVLHTLEEFLKVLASTKM